MKEIMDSVIERLVDLKGEEERKKITKVANILEGAIEHISDIGMPRGHFISHVKEQIMEAFEES